MAREYQYSDVDVDFKRNEFVNDVSVKYDRNAIRQSVINLLLTRRGEKPFNRNYGVGLHDILFENIGPLEITMLEKQIASQFVAFEPRVALIDVQFNDLVHNESNEMGIKVSYAILGGPTETPIRETLRLDLGKVR